MPRFATYNMENLFTRPLVMNREHDASGAEVLDDFAELNAIVLKQVYTAEDKGRLVELSLKYGFHRLNQSNPFIRLNKIRGRVFRQEEESGRVSVVANGREDWTGWFDLIREDLTWDATRNTGRVISEVSPDVLLCVEVEDRMTLERFNEQVLRTQFGEAAAYPYALLVDGNDERGIDVGILSRYPIISIRSHVHDRDADGSGRIFSRDCPEYEIDFGDSTIILLGNHFKSKRGGDDTAAKARRTRQSGRVKEIYQDALERSDLVIIGGDLNDTPESGPITALTEGLATARRPRDVMTSPLNTDPLPGTYGTGLASGKFDYLFLSPALWQNLSAVGIERRGTYHPRKWVPFDSVTGERDQASDHALLWADINL